MPLVFAPTAWAYVVNTDQSGIYVTPWDPGTVTMQVKLPTTANLQDGTSYASSVQSAMQTWNAQLGVVQFNPQTTSTLSPAPAGSYSNGDGINQIAMDSTYDGTAFGSGVLAITLYYTSGNSRAEADIIINTSWTWDSYRGNLVNGRQDIRRVVIHELGHVLGLNHPDQATPPQAVAAIMNSHVGNLDTMQTDDIAGAQLLYGSVGFVPVNNNFANATLINLSSSSIQLTGTNVAATRQSGEPNHAGANAPTGHSVWWSWTAPGSGSTTITTLGSNFDTVLAVYTGTSVTALTSVASNDDAQNDANGHIRTSTVTFNAIGGTTYSIAVDGWGSTSQQDLNTYTGAITLNFSYAGPFGDVAPSITTQPVSQTVTAGSIVTFTAAASGTPVPTYQWQKNGVNISGATSSSYLIGSAVVGDTGNYAVIATNSVSSATSNVATLTVNPVPVGPVITTQPLSQSIAAGNSVTFTVAASGTPAPSFQWKKGGVNIGGATGSSYIIASVTAGNAGSYTVVATNSAGSATSNAAVLTVTPPVTAPSNAVITITVE